MPAVVESATFPQQLAMNNPAGASAPSPGTPADQIASKVAEDDALSSVTTGFGLLNEPDAGIDYWRMLNYYEDAYATIRRVLGKDVAVSA